MGNVTDDEFGRFSAFVTSDADARERLLGITDAGVFAITAARLAVAHCYDLIEDDFRERLDAARSDWFRRWI